MTRRQPGEGTIEELPSGRFRARLPLPDGIRHELGTHESYDEAEGVIAAALILARENSVAPVGGVTVRAWGPKFLDELELNGYRAMPNARSIFRCYIEKANWAAWPIKRVTTRVLQAWLDEIRQSPQYRRQIATNVRKLFHRARAKGYVDADPTIELELPALLPTTEDPWTFLEPAEQAALAACEEIPKPWRLQARFAIGAGIRQGEQWALRRADIRIDGSHPEMTIRYGSPNGPPKGNKIRIVPLFGDALEALREWLALLPSWCPRNPKRLVFPGQHGGFLKEPPRQWHDWIAAAGIARHVRWHDLRHTCGASLVSGWWGRSWSLQEVRDLLGHASISETERYGHLGITALKLAAHETPGQVHAKPTGSGSAGNGGGFSTNRVDDGGGTGHEGLRELTPPNGLGVGCDLDGLARRLLEVVAEGRSPGALPEALADAVLLSRGARLARGVLAGGPHALDRALDLAETILAGGSESYRQAVIRGAGKATS